MRETTAPTLTRSFTGDLCTVWVTMDGKEPVVKLSLDTTLLPKMTVEQLEQLAQDLASSSNWVRAAVAKFRRQQQAVAT